MIGLWLMIWYLNWFQIEALPEIVKAVGDKIDVYLDSGIRQGTDVFKALALGAKMVNCISLFMEYNYYLSFYWWFIQTEQTGN